MKKYIRTAKITTDEEAKEIESLVWDKLAATGFLDILVDSVEVNQLQRRYSATIILRNITFNGVKLKSKKFTASPIDFGSVEDHVDNLVDEVYMYVHNIAEDHYAKLGVYKEKY